MQTISWNEDLKIGIKTVDNQHRKLISIANEFINAANQHSRGIVLGRILTRLREQAVSHLSAEEKLMAQARYGKRSVRSLENARFKVAMKQFQHHLKVSGEVTFKDIHQFKQHMVQHIKGAKQVIIKSTFIH